MSARNNEELSIKLSLINLVDKPIEFKADFKEPGRFEMSPRSGKIQGRRHTDLNVTAKYSKLDHSEMNSCHIIIDARTNAEEPQYRLDVKISCLPKIMSEGTFSTKIKYDVIGAGIHKTFEQSRSIKVNTLALEGCDDKSEEERQKILENEMLRLGEQSDLLEDFPWSENVDDNEEEPKMLEDIPSYSLENTFGFKPLFS